MANVLTVDKQIAVIGALAEGSSKKCGTCATRSSILLKTSNHCSAETMTNTYISELRKVIRELHGTESTHIESVPVTETFQGKTVWAGIVEVFELHGHPKATHAYAWAHETDNPEYPIRHITVLKIPPVVSPVTAVRAAIAQEFKLGTAEEA